MHFTGRWLLRIAGFLAVLVIADMAAGFLRISYWTPFENRNALRIFAHQQEDFRAEVLFLGSSRIRTAVMPAVVEKSLSSGLGRNINTYCLGQNGATAYTSWLVLDDVVAVHGPPDLIVLELSPGSVNAHNHSVTGDLRYYSSIPEIAVAAGWIDNRERLSAAAAGCFRGFSSLLLFGTRPLYVDDFEEVVARHIRRRGAQFPPGGSDHRHRLSDLDERQRRNLLAHAAAYSRQHYVDRYEIGGAPGAGLQAIVTFARDRDIPLVLVDLPAAPGYAEAVSTPRDIDLFRDTLDGVLADPQLQVVEAGLRGLELTDEDFLDLTHLHPDGARKISRYLATSTLLPLMEGQTVGSAQ